MAIKSKKEKISGRLRRKLRVRKNLSGDNTRPRMSVFKSTKHTYAQLITDQEGKTLVSASTRDADVQTKLKSLEGGDKASTKSQQAAQAVGLIIAEKAKAKKVSTIVFDRNGYVFHGRVKALADGAREGGLKF